MSASIRRYSGMLIFHGRVKTVGILNRGFVPQVVGRACRVALDHPSLIGKVISRPIEPDRRAAEVLGFDDERVSLPSADGLSHPRRNVEQIGKGLIQVNHSNRAGVFVPYEHFVLRLNELKRERHVGGARHAPLKALGLRIARHLLRIDDEQGIVLQTSFEKPLSLRQRLGLVRDRATFHDTQTRRLRQVCPDEILKRRR